MSQIKSAILAGALMASLSLSGCGDENSLAVYDSEGGGNHPTGWATAHKASAQSNMRGCSECHGEKLDGGISLVSCMSPAIKGFTCHASNPSEYPGCVSCHGGTPDGPFGNTAPNRKFAHAKHTALTTATGIGCDSCHLNAGSGSSNHADGAVMVTMSSAFKAKTLSTFGYATASGTCSGTSCHGGQVTPPWSTGTISMSTDCNLCHEQGTAPATPQYNSYFSGTKDGRNLHMLHLNTPNTAQPIVCTDCHNIGILTDYRQHFSGIRTKSFTAPRNTIGNKGGAGPTQIGTYTGTTQTCSSIACHPDTTWTQP